MTNSILSSEYVADTMALVLHLEKRRSSALVKQIFEAAGVVTRSLTSQERAAKLRKGAEGRKRGDLSLRNFAPSPFFAGRLGPISVNPVVPRPLTQRNLFQVLS